jgi:CheY-like chemotaxis protein
MAARRVLVIEDQSDTAEMVRLLLFSMGHVAEVAGDGPSALKLVPDFRPDVVFLDLGLPGLSGFEVAQLLRQVPGFQSLWIIALTGSARYEDRERAFAAGCDHYLIKPLDPVFVSALLGPAKAS